MEERKARLRALASKAGRLRENPVKERLAPEETTAQPTTADAGEADAATEPALKKSKTDTSSIVLQKALEKAQKAEEVTNETATTASKTIDWDLKRDIQPKLDKLEKRYERCLIKLLKKRLESEAENER